MRGLNLSECGSKNGLDGENHKDEVAEICYNKGCTETRDILIEKMLRYEGLFETIIKVS